MDKLVDTTVNLVEEGRLQQAVEVLQQGITLLSSTYPGRYDGGTRPEHCHTARLAVQAGQVAGGSEATRVAVCSKALHDWQTAAANDSSCCSGGLSGPCVHWLCCCT